MARLEFPAEWRFEADGMAMPDGLVEALNQRVIRKVASASSQPYAVVEAMKRRFGSDSSSSSLEWAYSDLRTLMVDFEDNAAMFVEALWLGLEDARTLGAPVPPAETLNKVFREHDFPYELRPPNLYRTERDASFVAEDEATENTGQSETAPMVYLIGEELGHGGFGSVFAVKRRTSVATLDFAMKLLNPSPFVDPEKAKSRFIREISAVARLQHRGIVQYVDAGINNRGHYLIMSLIDGKNLREHCKSISHPERLALMVDVLEAVAYAHSNGVLHRDLKPSNILVRESDCQPIILDFGMSYLTDELSAESLTASGAGSIGYIPSEVLANPKLRSVLHDVYSCGVIAYELIAGQRPDPADYKHLASLHDEALAPIDDVLKKAIAPAPERYPSAAIFRDQLRTATAHLPKTPEE